MVTYYNGIIIEKLNSLFSFLITELKNARLKYGMILCHYAET